jgi:hypothetical protein
MSKNQKPQVRPEDVLAQLRAILWPDDDTEHEWDSDTLGEIGNALIEGGYCPDELRKQGT